MLGRISGTVLEVFPQKLELKIRQDTCPKNHRTLLAKSKSEQFDPSIKKEVTSLIGFEQLKSSRNHLHSDSRRLRQQSPTVLETLSWLHPLIGFLKPQGKVLQNPSNTAIQIIQATRQVDSELGGEALVETYELAQLREL